MMRDNGSEVKNEERKEGTVSYQQPILIRESLISEPFETNYYLLWEVRYADYEHSFRRRNPLLMNEYIYGHLDWNGI